jgi:hypothetical protein
LAGKFFIEHASAILIDDATEQIITVLIDGRHKTTLHGSPFGLLFCLCWTNNVLPRGDFPQPAPLMFISPSVSPRTDPFMAYFFSASGTELRNVVNNDMTKVL